MPRKGRVRPSWPPVMLRAKSRPDHPDHIEVFYNRWPRHTTIGSVSPVAYEAAYGEAQALEPRAIANLGGTSPPDPPPLIPRIGRDDGRATVTPTEPRKEVIVAKIG